MPCSRVFLVPLVMLFILLSVVGLHTRVAVAGVSGSMAVFYPELAGYAAPEWVEEGLRLTYYVASASIPEGRYVYFRDDDGMFVDQFGNRYRREAAEATSGHGLMQVDVLSTGKWCVLDVNLLPYVGTAPYVTSLTQRLSVVDVAAAAGDYWLPPEFLALLPAGEHGRLRIVRMPYSIGGRTYRAIRFHYEEGRTVFVYDLDSGVLIYYGTGGVSSLSKGFTYDLDRAGASFLTHTELIDMRVIQWPWAGSKPPSWLSDVQSLHYSGAVSVQIPGTPVFPIGLEASVRVLRRGLTWFLSETQSVLASPPGLPPVPTTMLTVSGVVQAGGLWLPPQAADKLEAGQVLDVDSVTGVVTSVSAVGKTEDGVPMITIREDGHEGVFVNEFTYRMDTGLMTAWRHYQAQFNQLQEIYLTDVR